MAELAVLERLLKEKNQLEMYIELIDNNDIDKLRRYIEKEIALIDTVIKTG